MSRLDLRAPVVAAPMAGGPSTPELVAAVGAAGGLGLLAAGYKTPEAMAAEIDRVRALNDAVFGVNVFVPAPADRTRDAAAVARYADALAEAAGAHGVTLPEARWDDTDHYAAKLDLLVRRRVPVVTFTFGCPAPDVVARLQDAGSQVVVTVTDADEALAAARAGADAICAQGVDAGGHRGTHDVAKAPSADSWPRLLARVRSVVTLPVLVAGGIMRAEQVRDALRQGAAAVQCGTAFLLTDEAGTGAAYRKALRDTAFDATTVTRAFSGRPARGLVNGFVERYDPLAPVVYPQVDQLTKPLRAAAARAQDPAGLALWAGTGWREVTGGPAAGALYCTC